MQITPWFELTSSKNKAALMAALPSWSWCGDPYVTIDANVPTAQKLLYFPCQPGLKIRPGLGPLEEAVTWNKIAQAVHDIPQRTYPVLLDFEYAWKDAFPKHPLSDKVWWKRVRANMAALPGARQYLVYPSTVSGDSAIAACQHRFMELMMTQLDAAPLFCNWDCPRAFYATTAQDGYVADWDSAFARRRNGCHKINCNNDSTGNGNEGWPDFQLSLPLKAIGTGDVILWPGIDRWADGEIVKKALWG